MLAFLQESASRMRWNHLVGVSIWVPCYWLSDRKEQSL